MEKFKNIRWHQYKVNLERRAKIKGHKPCLLWFTGLSGSGKSTIAQVLDMDLNEKNKHTYVLDGDNLRHGLNKDLGFREQERKENIRRVGEVAKLFVDSGLITITAFISPFIEDRLLVRNLLKDKSFIEIYTKCSLDICKKRDPKGLYKKALAGEIDNFTGISHPYEEPKNPEIILETDKKSIEDCTKQVLDYLMERKIL